jgi:hypothetical protein
MPTMSEFEEQASSTSNVAGALVAADSYDPEQAAQALQQARETGLPPSLMGGAPDPEIARRQRLSERRQTLETSPKLTAWLEQQAREKPYLVSIVQDDLNPLAEVDAAISTAISTAKQIAQVPNVARYRLAEAVFGTAALVPGVASDTGAEGPLPLAASGITGALLRKAFKDDTATYLEAGNENPFAATEQFFLDLARGQRLAAEQAEGNRAAMGAIERGFYGGLESFAMMTPGIAATIATRNPAYALAYGGTIAGGRAYAQAREEGVSPTTSAAFAFAQGGTEALFERMPLLRAISDLKAGDSLATMFIKNLAREVPTEQATTLVQDFNEWAIINPEKTLGEFASERPERALETLVATATATGGNTVLMKAIDMAAGVDQEARSAQELGVLLGEIQRLAAATATLQRDTETFEGFLQSVSDDETMPEFLYLDGKTLLDSGLAQQLIEMSPTVAEQAALIQTGTMIRIPTAEVMGRFNQEMISLLPDLRRDPNGMTQREAQSYVAENEPRLKSLVERVLSSGVETDEQVQARDYIRQTLSDELASQAGVQKNVADQYATLVSAFYSTMAKRRGMDARTLFDEQRLRVFGEGIQERTDVASQGQMRELTRARQDGVDAVVEGGSLTLIHGSTSADLALDNVQIVREGQKQGKKGRKYGGFYVSPVSDLEAAEGYARMGEGTPTIYNVNIREGTKVLQKEGDITRLSEDYIRQLINEGYGLVVGTDPRGRTEYVVIDKNAIESLQTRPTQNAFEELAQYAQTPAFTQWFGASTVVDETGAPIVLYHGTSKDKDFAAFNIGKRGAWFTTDPKEASAYASDNDSQNFIFRNGEYVATNTAARVIPAYVKIENPYTMTEQDRQRLNVENYAKAQAAFFDELRARGHDGVKVDGTTWVVLGSPTQIKSTMNRGTYDATKANMLHQAAYTDQFYQTATVRRGEETLEKYGLERGRRWKTREVAAALEARQREKYGTIDPKDRSEKSTDNIANWMMEEVLFAMLNPNKSGVGWYSEKFQRALDTMGDVFPELKEDKVSRDLMTALIAITSDGQKVVPNFTQAMDIYSRFRSGGETEGKFTTSRGHMRQESIDNNLAVLQRLYDSIGAEGMRDYLMQEKPISELKQIAKANGGTLKSDYQAHINMPMAAVEFGPKLGAFYANLMGAHGYLTMDRWWSRTFNRYRGTLLAQPTDAGYQRFKELMIVNLPEYANMPPDMISNDEVLAAVVQPRDSYAAKNFKNGTEFEKAANTIYKAAFENLEDAPFNATDRTFMLNAVTKAQALLSQQGYDLSVADIQAILWYYEKRLYGELGARQTADISYEEAAKRVAAGYAGGQGGQLVPDDTGAAQQDGGAVAEGVPAQDAFFQEEFLPPERLDGQVENRPAINFEVAPDPDNQALAAEWNALTQRQQAEISVRILERFLPGILQRLNASGELLPQTGSFEDATTASFALRLDQGDPGAVTRFLGFILNQKEMATFGADPFDGGEGVGAVTVEIGDKTTEEIDAIYQRLRQITVDGEKPVGGQSTSGGVMTILNFSGVDTKRLRDLVNQALDDAFMVGDTTVFAMFPGKGDYDYANEDADPRGDEGANRQWARGVRTEATDVLRQELDAAKRGVAERRGDGERGARGQGQRLMQQQGERVVRGSFSPSQLTIRLTNARDLSTFLHESGHFFLHMLVDLASQPGAPQDLIDDATKALEWMDVKPQEGKTLFETWLGMSVQQQTFGHEKFARAFEVYLSEGKAPSAELESVFRSFKRWLLEVYKDLIAYARGQNTSFNRAHVTRGEKTGVLNDEIRAVFDRMLASTEEIQNAEAMRSMGMMFSSEADAAKFGIDWRAYQSVAQGATEEAVDDMNARSVRQMKWLSNARSRMLRKLQKEAGETRSRVRDVVTEEIAAEPLYRAWAFLTNPTNDPETGGRFSLEELREFERTSDQGTTGTEAQRDRMFVIARLREEGMVAAQGEDGWRPEAVAEIFGFTSADELITKILNSPSPEQAIAARTDERMIRDHSDLNTPEGRNAMVDAALAGELRTRMVEIELNALERASKTKEPTVAQVARRFAQNMIGGMRVRDIRPGQFMGSASRAARESIAAMKGGNMRQAALQKRNQLVNQYAGRYAQEALDDIQAAVRYLRKFERDGVRKNVAIEQLDQIDKLLERFEFRRVTNRELDKRQSLADWIEDQRANGIEPDVPEYLLNEVSRVNYRSLTVDEFMGLVDSVKQIEHIGRLKKKLLVSKDKREFAEIVFAINASILQNAGNRRRDNRQTTSAQAQALEKLRTFAAAHRKLSSLVYQLDGFKDNGPLWNALVRTANERGDFEATRLSETTEALAKLLAGLKRDSRFSRGMWFPSINMSLRWEERIGVALNWGNEGNRQRLLDGRNWDLAKIQPVLDSLSKQDWDFVQAVWDMFENMRPEIGAKERRLFGKEPEWVQAAPVITQFGTYRGGYFPAVYDTQENLQSQKFEEAEYAKRQLQGARAAATTRRNFVKARSEEVKGRPILLTMDAVWRGLTDVIHDLAWHEWLIDANRLMNDENVDGAIRDTWGSEIVTQIRSAINDIAAGEATKPHAMDPLLRHMRTGASVAGLGFNLMNALIQPLGFTQSIVRVGAKWIAQGVVAYATNPIALARQILEKSEMMRNRGRTMNRELNDIRNSVRGKGATRIAIDQAVFMPMTAMQGLVDLPTWWGAYQKALADMPNSMNADEAEATAIAVADQAVLASQTGGQVKDLAAIQRGPEALKLFTTFYGYFSGTYNLAVERARATSFKSPAQVARLASDYLLLLCLPAVMTELIYSFFEGDDDDEEGLAKRLASAQVSYLFGMMVGVREMSGAAQITLGLETNGGAGYGGPAGLRLVQETFRLGQQINQGELDRALIRSGVNVAGIALHLPSGQINRAVDGLIAIAEGRAETPLVLIGGAPPQ